MKQNNELADMDLIMRLYEFANTAEVQSAWLTVLHSKIDSYKDFLNLPDYPYTSTHNEQFIKLPRSLQQQIIDKKIRFFVIDGYKVAKDTGMGRRVNTIMQTAFFLISGVLPEAKALELIFFCFR
jgi:Pyruvate/2-oxoacid:ferredoxin oxidoreductase gamma subunit